MKDGTVREGIFKNNIFYGENSPQKMEENRLFSHKRNFSDEKSGKKFSMSPK